MVPIDKTEQISLKGLGQNTYQTHCLSCHGADFKGASVYTVPSLLGLKDRMKASDVTQLVKNGRGAMPSFAYLSDQQVEGLANYLLKQADQQITGSADRQDWPYPYYMNGYNRFNAPDGYPAIAPLPGARSMPLTSTKEKSSGKSPWAITMNFLLPEIRPQVRKTMAVRLLLPEV